MFVLGRSENAMVQSSIKNENARWFRKNYLHIKWHSRYGDILQGDFEEDYHKLAYKSMCAFNWSQKYCPKVPWFLKTDDDTVHDMYRLKDVLKDIEDKDMRWSILDVLIAWFFSYTNSWTCHVCELFSRIEVVKNWTDRNVITCNINEGPVVRVGGVPRYVRY